MPTTTRTTREQDTDSSIPSAHSDEELVRDCIAGDQQAWSQLLNKYKNLIFSVPIKYGFSQEEATDVFQEVCLELVSGLENVRKPRALAKWLLMVTAHKCFHRKRLSKRFVSLENEAPEAPEGEVPPEVLEIMAQTETEQAFREAISELSSQCRQLVKMLFFQEPPLPYRDVAQGLGMAVGSIGLIRQRCLEKLRKKVEGLQFR
jgi:RNA polymerase sigma factor (sigma-70 family)